MADSNRRDFLKLAGTGAFGAALSSSIDRALAVTPARRAGTIEDVEHIVVLTQENRSFDHYFGTMRGVRGFGDPRAVRLSTGRNVWHQPYGDGFVLPFRPDADFGQKFLEDVSHSWETGQQAWNGGKYDQWMPAKGAAAMTYYRRKDIPFHFALADAFTVCDAYYTSLMGPTDPNRYHLWSGWCGNDGKGGGPVVDNAEAGYDWTTFPERLLRHGISWKVYQDAGVGLDAAGYWGWTENPYIGNYGDNSLLYFHQYQNAAAGSRLAKAARSGTSIKDGGTLFDALRADVKAGRLPKVSYIVAPEAYTEHPNWIPNYGAWYLAQILDALTSNPEVWAKTVLFYNFDENGGFFDHVVPPTPPISAAHGRSTVSTRNEIFHGNASHTTAGPYGFCARVPMLVVSPWSKGGWVNSEVFDHTSVIRFIEKRFESSVPGLHEPNITAWRRAVAGDLTSTLDFVGGDVVFPKLPDTDSFAPADTAARYDDYAPSIPATQTMPAQEKGVRYARPLPYRINANGVADTTAGTLKLTFGNASQRNAAAFFHVRTAGDAIAPRGNTVGASDRLVDTLAIGTGKTYDVQAHGPNGFYRSWRGAMRKNAHNVVVESVVDHRRNAVVLTMVNAGPAAVVVKLANGYTGAVRSRALAPKRIWAVVWDAESLSGWYDAVVSVTGDTLFRVEIAGHVETGKASISDPAFGGR